VTFFVQLVVAEPFLNKFHLIFVFREGPTDVEIDSVSLGDFVNFVHNFRFFCLQNVSGSLVWIPNEEIWVISFE